MPKHITIHANIARIMSTYGMNALFKGLVIIPYEQVYYRQKKCVQYNSGHVANYKDVVDFEAVRKGLHTV